MGIVRVMGELPGEARDYRCENTPPLQLTMHLHFREAHYPFCITSYVTSLLYD